MVSAAQSIRVRVRNLLLEESAKPFSEKFDTTGLQALKEFTQRTIANVVFYDSQKGAISDLPWCAFLCLQCPEMSGLFLA